MRASLLFGVIFLYQTFSFCCSPTSKINLSLFAVFLEHVYGEVVLFPTFRQFLLTTSVHSFLSAVLGQLLPLLHGNVNGSKVIIQEFQECCRQGLFSDVTAAADGSDTSPASPHTSRPQTPVGEDSGVPSKARLKRIISENSVYEKRPEYRMCWYVHSEVLKSFDREHLPVPCQWNYVTQVPSSGKEEGGSMPGVAVLQTTPVAVKRKPTGSMSITRFMKRPRDAEQVSSCCGALPQCRAAGMELRVVHGQAAWHTSRIGLGERRQILSYRHCPLHKKILFVGKRVKSRDCKDDFFCASPAWTVCSMRNVVLLLFYHFLLFGSEHSQAVKRLGASARPWLYSCTEFVRGVLWTRVAARCIA